MGKTEMLHVFLQKNTQKNGAAILWLPHFLLFVGCEKVY